MPNNFFLYVLNGHYSITSFHIFSYVDLNSIYILTTS
uniref:Uncharacterized protein n=1 Tax=Polysiphonia sp. TaxID=1967842 RepID=A0A1Z1MUE3_9FLOR|nr:hypothetical protein [Polysiphonia sp.]